MAWRITFLVFILNFISIFAQDYEIKECIRGKEKKRIEIECPVNTKIRLDQTIFGISKWISSTACSYTVQDCSEKIDLFDSCEGQEKCSVLLEKTYSAKCGGYATFLRVLYDCKPELNVVTSSQVLSSTTLWSPPIAIRDDSPSRTPEKITESDDIGLIAGCAVAVIITVIMLLFAIYLVVKRLCRPSPSDDENQNIHQKPDIVIFDMVCCCLRSEPAKPRPVADQNQNIQTSAPLRISDRPVPIGEVTTATVNEFNQTSTPTVSNNTSSNNHQQTSSNRADSRQSNMPTAHNNGQNSAVGLPNTRNSSAC